MAEKRSKKKEKPARVAMPEQSPDIRRRNFEEVPTGYTMEMAQEEAARCLQCKKPGCVTGCPVHVDIPGFIASSPKGDITGAIRNLWAKNALPAICGRVCPQEIQCEGRCIVGKKGEPVAIGNLERFCADYEREFGTGELPPVPASTGKRVAVVGSGPSGLTVAGDLIQKGHAVTVLEAFHKPGGVLVYGIPEFRLPKEIVAQEVNFLERLGAKVECNQVVGRTVSLDELFEQGYDAIYIGVGAGLAALYEHPRRKPDRHPVGQRIPHPGQPDEGLQVPRCRHPHPHGQERGGAGCRQRGHGLGPHRHAPGRRKRQNRLPPLTR
jgi:glutamate synthase (NADPH/NADH) small chain